MIFRLTKHRTLGLATMLVAAMLGPRPAVGQEFNCKVSVNFDALSGTDVSFFQDFEADLFEYINRQVWTEHRVAPEERVSCTFEIFLLEAVTLTRYRARVTVSSKRPIWGTVQESQVLQVGDDSWLFDYSRGSAIIRNPDQFDEITSLVDYYLFLVLGYDFDTFSPLGGTSYFAQARRIADLGSSANAPGWTALGDDRSRTTIVRQLLDPRFRGLREVYFAYHFDGLDHFVTETTQARDAMMTVLESLEQLKENNARAYVLDLFFDAKSSEVADVFRDSPLSGRAYDMLSTIDPAHLNVYESALVN